MKLSKLILTLSLLSAAPLHAQDYQAYNELLTKYAHPSGVDYKSWSKDKQDLAKLESVITAWSKIDSNKLSSKNKAAFRINIYNANMIDAALDHYPLKSVTKIGADFSIFDKKFIKTPSGTISLNTLEKKTLLRDFPDGRIHFAVNCASVSCPPLRNEAYTGSELEKQLSDQAVKFANSNHAVQTKGSTAKYSELFNWYASDFKTKNPATYLNKFRSSKLSTSLKVDWIKYDWNLNQSK